MFLHRFCFGFYLQAPVLISLSDGLLPRSVGSVGSVGRNNPYPLQIACEHFSPAIKILTKAGIQGEGIKHTNIIVMCGMAEGVTREYEHPLLPVLNEGRHWWSQENTLCVKVHCEEFK